MGTTRKKPAAGTAARAQHQARALSLHIGLNGVSASAYAGWDGPLAACEFDANDMAAIATSQGMKPTVFLTKKATRKNVLDTMRAAAKALGHGDLFFLTYSGHGGQMPDTSGEEPDRKDETWCLYDGQLIDDEIYAELSRFGEGVRVLVLSDSCHSGTVTRELPPPPPPPGTRTKMMPDAVAMRVYREHQDFYDKLKAAARAAGGAAIDPDTALAHVGAAAHATGMVGSFHPAVVLISGCQDNQTSLDGEHNGAFTEKVLRVWGNGSFSGDYTRFHARVRAAMPATQSPNLFVLGEARAFVAQRPFTV